MRPGDPLEYLEDPPGAPNERVMLSGSRSVGTERDKTSQGLLWLNENATFLLIKTHYSADG